MTTYTNNTENNVTLKVWTTEIDSVTENQLIMLKSKGVKTRAIFDHDWLDTHPNGKRVRYSKGGRAEFETTNSEQESLIRLMYTNLLLLRVMTISPFSTFYYD